MTARHLLGRPVEDCHGEEVGRVVDVWPYGGGFELELAVVRLRRFGVRRMLPIASLRVFGGVLRAAYTRAQIDDAPEVDGGRHGADDPWRAKAYWMYEDEGDTGTLRPPWRRRSGYSGTERPSPTSPNPTPSGS